MTRLLLPPEESMFYTGIGSRQTPLHVLVRMEEIARYLETKGFILRSGGARGADTAFEEGVSNDEKKVIYKTRDCEPWCLEEVKKYIPADRPPLSKMSKHVQNLLGRNMKQVLGYDGMTPSRFVVCWTYAGSDGGGTGYAMRCASAYDIPVYNLRIEQEDEKFMDWLASAPTV